MAQLSAHPIGVFDSGIGGLTVAHAIRVLMPKENMIYKLIGFLLKGSSGNEEFSPANAGKCARHAP